LLTANPDTLSRDIAIAIKHFCFNNLTEFFRRYEQELPMSRATFHRIIQGEYTVPEKIKEVESVAKRLGLVVGNEGGTEWLIQKTLVNKLIDLCTELTNNPSITNLGELKTFLDKYRLAVTL
jgi:hypothetical protein